MGVEFLLTALKYAPQIVEAGQDLYEYVSKALEVSKKEGGPTDADWAELHAMEEVQRKELNG